MADRQTGGKGAMCFQTGKKKCACYMFELCGNNIQAHASMEMERLKALSENSLFVFLL